MSTLWQKLFGVPRHRSEPAAETDVEDQDRWKEAFRDAAFLASGPRQVEEAQRRMTGHLGWAYELNERLGQRYEALLLGIADALDYCQGLRSPGAEVEAIEAQLAGLLARHRVEAWSPQAGEPRPEGCEVLGAVPSSDVAPGAVLSVARPGYVLGGRILRRAQVLVAAQPLPVPEEARPGEAGAAGGAPPGEPAPEAAAAGPENQDKSSAAQ